MLILPDRNVRQKDYQNLAPGTVLVTKVFPTIQGEGPFTGRRALFIRLAGCNLGAKEACPFCDTDFVFDKGQERLNADLIEEANKLMPRKHSRLLVLTGGEPLMQPWVSNLIELFLAYGWKVQIETNSYFWPPEMHGLAVRSFDLTTVVSPKVNARGIYPRLPPGLLNDMSCLKILVDATPDSPYHVLPEYARDAYNLGTPVYISPINVYMRAPVGVVSFFDPASPFDFRRCRENHLYAADIVRRYDYIMSLQTHLFFGAE